MEPTSQEQQKKAKGDWKEKLREDLKASPTPVGIAVGIAIAIPCAIRAQWEASQGNVEAAIGVSVMATLMTIIMPIGLHLFEKRRKRGNDADKTR